MVRGATEWELAAPQNRKELADCRVVDVTAGKKSPMRRSCSRIRRSIHAEGEVREEEGCLSIPGFRGYVIAPAVLSPVKAQNAKGEEFEIRGQRICWRVAFCHEIDHLNGVLFLQHLSMLKRDLIRRKIKKAQETGRVVSAGCRAALAAQCIDDA